MAFPNVVTRQTGEDSTGQTSRSVAFSGTAVAGELLFVVFAANDNAGTAVDTTWPGGWTELFDRVGPGTGTALASLACAYTTAVGGETSVTVGTSASVQADWCAFRMDGGNTWTVEVSTQVTSFGDSDPPSLTPSGGALDYLWMVVCGWDSAGFGQTATAAPANYSNLTQAITTSSGAGFATAERLLNAASENPGAITLSGSADSQAQTVAIATSGGGGGGTPGPALRTVQSGMRW